MLKRTRVALRKLIASIGLLSVEVIVILLFLVLGISLFSFLVKQIFIDKQEEFDHHVFAWLEHHVTPFNTSFMEFITFLGTHTFLIPANIILIGYFLLIKKHRWYSIKVVAISLSSTAMMFLLKAIFSRDRPLVPLLEPALGYSFPSGHSFVSFAFYGLLIYLAYKYLETPVLKWLIILGLSALIFLIGLSRIYLRVHYTSDVLAGFSIGIIWLVFSLWILQKMERYSQREIEPVVEEEV
jgi:undecaprenyl-diphosphatase